MVNCFINVKINPFLSPHGSKFFNYFYYHFVSMTSLTKFFKVAFKQGTERV